MLGQDRANLQFGDIDDILGYPQGKISQNIEAWLDLIHPDDQGQLRNAVEVHRKSTHPITYEYRIKTKEGGYRYWKDHGLPLLDTKGMPYKWIGVCTDITETRQAHEALQKSEKKYRSILESMQDEVYIISSAYRIEYMNLKMIQTTGRDASGETCHKTLYDTDERCSWCKMDQIQQGENAEYELTNPKDGRTYIITNSPIINADETISKLTILRDTTDKKEMENRLIQAQKMEAIGTFAGGIAHDFNNILFSMLGFLDLAMEDITEDSPVYKNLVQALIAAHWAKKMVGHILTFSRKGKLEKKPVQLQFVINNQ